MLAGAQAFLKKFAKQIHFLQIEILPDQKECGEKVEQVLRQFGLTRTEWVSQDRYFERADEIESGRKSGGSSFVEVEKLQRESMVEKGGKMVFRRAAATQALSQP